ncbi:hypothetical protein Taro_044809 [Colocasia esculenta]|uniref:Uncharacterized protein n=1 Tax=Colocasia esculenta TaxID=4460 RepID=A0A843WUY5_COLES|nr:hypothetical protein [Colocasia esculenta]
MKKREDHREPVGPTTARPPCAGRWCAGGVPVVHTTGLNWWWAPPGGAHRWCAPPGGLPGGVHHRGSPLGCALFFP